MKTLFMTGPRKLAEGKVDPLPSVESGQVHVRLELASICGSDMPGFMTGKNSLGESPLGFPSHECIGTVVAAADEVNLIGKKVIAIPHHDAGLREIFMAPRFKTYVIESNLPLETVILAQPLATVLAALDRLNSIEGKKIAVLGLGPIGLMFGYALRLKGAAHITGFDTRNRETAPFIDKFDRIETNHNREDRFDIVVEAVGHNQEVVNLAIDLAKDWGTVLFFGVPDDEIYQLDFRKFFQKRLQLIANVYPDWSKYLPVAEKFLALNPELGKLVTHVFDIDDAQQAYETAFIANLPGSGKVIIKTDSWSIGKIHD